MRISGDAFRVETNGSEESLVVEQYGGLAGVTRRVTISLAGWGAEEVAERIGELLRKRKENAARLERYLVAAAAETPT